MGRTLATVFLVLLVTSSMAGCAKKLPPPGGTPDQSPPRVVAFLPDSGATNVSRVDDIQVSFSESMNQRVSDDWIFLAPYARPRKYKWDGRTFRYQLSDTLAPNQTYAFVVAKGARDARGNLMRVGRTSHFTTGESFPPGEIVGEVEAKGHSVSDVYIWAYREDLSHAPDSTARDFDALSLVLPSKTFRLAGLPVPSRWKLYVFYDANKNLTFEPGTDRLTEHEESIVLSEEAARVDTLKLLSLDPSAPGFLSGTVVDSLAPENSSIALRAEFTPVDGQLEIAETPVQSGSFRIPLPAGTYKIFLFLDLNRNGKFETGEPISNSYEGALNPGDEVGDMILTAPSGSGTPVPSGSETPAPSGGETPAPSGGETSAPSTSEEP